MTRSSSVKIEDLAAARKTIAGTLQTTPLTRSLALSSLYGRDIYIKWENKFRTGAFKERGALNYLSQLDRKQRRMGVCAASAGNHALALSYHAKKLNIGCTLFMPLGAPLVKVQMSRSFGATVILHGENLHHTVERAKHHAKETGQTYVSPYDHPWIVAGQSTCGSEILEQCPQMDSIVVPVGGGGLLAGVAMAIKSQRPKTHVIGVQSKWALEQRWKIHEQFAIPPRSLADGIAVKTIGKVNKPLIDRYCDALLSVDEQEIAWAMVHCLEVEKAVIEGAAAVAFAVLQTNALPKRARHTVIVLSGSNVDMNVLSRLLEREMGARGRLIKLSLSIADRPGALHACTGIIASAGANVLHVQHDRSSSKVPGEVEITFSLEVRDEKHGKEVMQLLRSRKIVVRAEQ